MKRSYPFDNEENIKRVGETINVDEDTDSEFESGMIYVKDPMDKNDDNFIEHGEDVEDLFDELEDDESKS